MDGTTIGIIAGVAILAFGSYMRARSVRRKRPSPGDTPPAS